MREPGRAALTRLRRLVGFFFFELDVVWDCFPRDVVAIRADEARFFEDCVPVVVFFAGVAAFTDFGRFRAALLHTNAAV
jgi:hypothetical protein